MYEKELFFEKSGAPKEDGEIVPCIKNKASRGDLLLF